MEQLIKMRWGLHERRHEDARAGEREKKTNNENGDTDQQSYTCWRSKWSLELFSTFFTIKWHPLGQGGGKTSWLLVMLHDSPRWAAWFQDGELFFHLITVDSERREEKDEHAQWVIEMARHLLRINVLSPLTCTRPGAAGEGERKRSQILIVSSRKTSSSRSRSRRNCYWVNECSLETHLLVKYNITHDTNATIINVTLVNEMWCVTPLHLSIQCNWTPAGFTCTCIKHIISFLLFFPDHLSAWKGCTESDRRMNQDERAINIERVNQPTRSIRMEAGSE